MEWLPTADVEEKPSNKSKRESCFERDEDLKQSAETCNGERMRELTAGSNKGFQEPREFGRGWEPEINNHFIQGLWERKYIMELIQN